MSHWGACTAEISVLSCTLKEFVNIRGSDHIVIDRITGNWYTCVSETQSTRPDFPTCGSGTVAGVLSPAIQSAFGSCGCAGIIKL